jgi:hypothetical protein
MRGLLVTLVAFYLNPAEIAISVTKEVDFISGENLALRVPGCPKT